VDCSRPTGRLPEILRRRAFRRFWSAQTVSYLGDQVTLIALPLVAVLALAATPAQVGLLATAATLPPLLIGVHAGAWIDRLEQPRPVLVGADVARALLLASVPIAYALAGLSMVQLYAVALASGAARVLFDVCSAGVVPALIPVEQRVPANALLRGSFSFSWVAGPGAGGALVGLLTAPVPSSPMRCPSWSRRCSSAASISGAALHATRHGAASVPACASSPRTRSCDPCWRAAPC
jgi:hypothetical protein